MKKSNYVLYRAIKRAAASNEELYDSYAEALEFAAETGYGLLDGSIDWDSLDGDEIDFWVEAFKPEPEQSDRLDVSIKTDIGEIGLRLQPFSGKEAPPGALLADAMFGGISLEPNHPKGWEGLLEAELAIAMAPEVADEDACSVLYGGETKRWLRQPLDIPEGEEVIAKYWSKGTLYLITERP